MNTTPKIGGLSQLADAAREVTGGEQYYPIRRRRQPRRLNPNRDGIAWLEGPDNHFDDTDVEYEDTDAGAPGIINTFAYGRLRKTYPRPMFQVIDDQAFSGSNLPRKPCPCDDFSRTWDATRCDDHHELPYDTETGTWRRPMTEAASVIADSFNQIIRQAQERASLLARNSPYCPCGCGMQMAGFLEEAPSPNPRLYVSGETDQGLQSFSFEVGEGGGFVAF